MLTRVKAAVAGGGYVVLGRVSKAFSTLTAEPIKLVVGCAAIGAVHLVLHMRLKDIGGGKVAGCHRVYPYALRTPLKLQSNWVQLLTVSIFRHDSHQPRDQLMAPYLKSSVLERILL